MTASFQALQRDSSVNNPQNRASSFLQKGIDTSFRCISYPFRQIQAACSKIVEKQFYFDNYTKTETELAPQRVQLLSTNNGQRIQLPTDDGDSLDVALFEGTLKKAIIFAKGILGYYEEIPESARFIEFVRQHVDKEITVLLFNPRGVNESTGRPSIEKLGADVATLYEFLIKKGYQLPDIVCYGHSMGAVNCINGIRKIQKKYGNTDIEASTNIIVDRAPHNIADLAKHAMGNAITGTIAKIVFWIAGWSTPNISNDFLKIQGNKAIIESSVDKIVPPAISLYNAVKRLHKLKNVKVVSLATYADRSTSHYIGSIDDGANLKGKTVFHHTRSFTGKEGLQVAKIFKRQLGFIN